jgi:F-type H+/Na+-transporting ATPase subunit alpha
VTRNQIETGQRMTEILKQGQYQPLPVEEQVAIFWMASNGFLADVEVDQVQDFAQQYVEYMRNAHADLLAKILEQGALDDDLTAALKKATEDFKGGSQWASGRAAA